MRLTLIVVVMRYVCYNYDVNKLIELFYNAGIIDVNMEMVNHGGHVGIIFYGRKSIYLESCENYSDLDRAPFRELVGAIKRKIIKRVKSILKRT